MKKNKPKVKSWYCEIFRTHFYFMLNSTVGQLEEFSFKKLGYKATPGGAAALTHVWQPNKGGNYIIIWVRKGKMDYPILAHECLHAAHATLDYIGFKSSSDNDEIQAYLMTHIMEQALK